MDIAKDMNRFFQNPFWSTVLAPHTIRDIYDELEDAKVPTTILVSEQLPEATVNAGLFGRNDIKGDQNNSSFLPREEYIK